MITIRKFILKDSPELRESFRVYQMHYQKVNELKFLRTVFSPLRFLGVKKPTLPIRNVVIDSSNQEKFKRIRPLVNSNEDYLLYVSDLSTKRSKRFLKLLEPSVHCITFPSYYPGYFRLLPSILITALFKSRSLGPNALVRLRFFVHLLQNLIHYEWILKTSGAKYLLTANEDTWFSPVSTQFCKEMGVKTINVMHGRVYDTRQFYDVSIVYGKESEVEVKKYVSPLTRVLRHFPVEVKETPAHSKNAAFSKKLVLFDQPIFAHYSAALKAQIYALLEDLAKNHGFEIGVKLHPVQSQERTPENSSLRFYTDTPNDQLLKEYGIALAVCSTVGLEVIASGVPVLYVDYENTLDHFLQIKFLKPVACPTISGLKSRIFELQNAAFYESFYQAEVKLLRDEYQSDQAFNPLQS